MKSWLAYCGAFACALGAAFLCYMAAFRMLMSGSGYGMEGLILLAVILPTIAGLIAFGVTYFAFAKQSYALVGWCYGIAFVAFATAICFALIITDLLEEIVATGLWSVTLFVGGRVLTQRAAYE